MINFKGRSISIHNADRITRSVNSIYPHLSESKISKSVDKQTEFLLYDSATFQKLHDFKLKNLVKLKTLRLKEFSGMDLYHQIIFMLKEQKLGNCYELSRLAEIISKINGQNNVYPMKMYVTRNRSGADVPLDHVVSVVTDKKINPKQKFMFKNKEAIILDPWLGITDFVSGYIEKIKNDFKNNFQFMPDNDLSIYFASKLAKNIKKFKELKKEKCFNPDVKFLLHDDDIVSPEQAKQLRIEYQELVIKDFKKIEL